LFNENIGQEKHLVSSLTENKLKLRSFKLNQIDLPIIDVIDFEKKNY